MNSKPNILFCVTGSVATIKVYELSKLLQQFANVKVCCTQASTHFFDKKRLKLECNNVEIFGDEDEWNGWKKRGDPILHIELRKWADIMIIAPLDANTLAKISNGICDNLISCVFRAWNFANNNKKIFVAPAMNTLLLFSRSREPCFIASRTLDLTVYSIQPGFRRVCSKKSDLADIRSPFC